MKYNEIPSSTSSTFMTKIEAQFGLRYGENRKIGV